MGSDSIPQEAEGIFSFGVNMGSDSIPQEVEGIFPLELTWVLTPFLKR